MPPSKLKTRKERAVIILKVKISLQDRRSHVSQNSDLKIQRRNRESHTSERAMSKLKKRWKLKD